MCPCAAQRQGRTGARGSGQSLAAVARWDNILLMRARVLREGGGPRSPTSSPASLSEIGARGGRQIPAGTPGEAPQALRRSCTREQCTPGSAGPGGSARAGTPLILSACAPGRLDTAGSRRAGRWRGCRCGRCRRRRTTSKRTRRGRSACDIACAAARPGSRAVGTMLGE